MEMFNKIHDGGNTVVLVTHEEDIANYAKRVIRLRDGIIETDITRDLSPAGGSGRAHTNLE